MIVLIVITAVFIALKLASQIDWSWFWVLSPVLIPLIAAFCIDILKGISQLANGIDDYSRYFDVVRKQSSSFNRDDPNTW